MRVLWSHNFRTGHSNAGCFMHTTANALRDAGINLQVEYLGDLRSIWAIRRARRKVRTLARGFDIVHSQYGSVCAFASLGSNKPFAITLRGNDWNLHKATFHWLWAHTRLARWTTEVVLGSNPVVTAVSGRIAAEVLEKFPGLTVEVIPAAIDLNRWVPRSAPPATRRQAPRVLFTASNPRDPIKGYDLFERTIRRAQERIPSLVPVVATGVSHEDMPTLVASCDVVLCTSETEGWPNSIKEALACNIPFVSTDVSDLAAVAAVEETTCRVCPNDHIALSDALCAVLSGPPPTDLRRHVACMDLKPTAARLVAVYQQMLKA